MLFTWLKKRSQNNTTFSIYVNGEKIDLIIRRIKDIFDQSEYLLKVNELEKNLGYFKYKTEGFQSFLMPFKMDLIFVDYDGKTIEILSSLKANTITKRIHGAKYLYILPEGFIKVHSISNDSIISHQKIIEHSWYE